MTRLALPTDSGTLVKCLASMWLTLSAWLGEDLLASLSRGSLELLGSPASTCIRGSFRRKCQSLRLAVNRGKALLLILAHHSGTRRHMGYDASLHAGRCSRQDALAPRAGLVTNLMDDRLDFHCD